MKRPTLEGLCSYFSIPPSFLTRRMFGIALGASLAMCTRDLSSLHGTDALDGATDGYAQHYDGNDTKERNENPQYDANLEAGWDAEIDARYDARGDIFVPDAARDLFPEGIPDGMANDGRLDMYTARGDAEIPDAAVRDSYTSLDSNISLDAVSTDAAYIPPDFAPAPDVGSDSFSPCFPVPCVFPDLSYADVIPDAGIDSSFSDALVDPCPGTAPLNTLQAGVCVGSYQRCDTAGWVDDYSGLARYEVIEAAIDESDNDCDGIEDDTAWRQISAGLFHTCAVRNEGSVQCWGSNSDGQRDDVPEGTFVAVESGAYHSCGLKIDYSIECWGRNTYGQLEVPPGGYIQLDAGYNHTCGLKDDNTIECWGDDSYGQSSAMPSGRFTQVSAGINHSCALGEDETIACWGNNGNGQAPPFVAGNFSQVSAGNQHTCGLTSESIECWGRSEQTTSRTGAYQQISADYDYNCSLGLDAAIACWGVGEGVGGMVSPEGSFTQLDVGVYHSCAISLDGLIDCWGREDLGPP